MNHVFLIGNLGMDPEIRYTSTGVQIARLRLAVNDYWVNKDTGEREQKTNWITVVAFGRLAENCQKYLKKGNKIAVRGALSYREWVDQNGNKRSTLEVKMLEMEMLTPKTSLASDVSETPPEEPIVEDVDESSVDLDEDIPF